MHRSGGADRRSIWFALPILLLAASTAPAADWAMAVHGGAGSGEWEHMDAASAAAYRAGLTRALQAGVSKLQTGSRAIDAVEAAIRVLEDDPLFNAGRGAVFNAEGKNEMDASIMDGQTLAAGSVAGVHFTKNPISLARAVMEKTPHVLIIGTGADAFAVKAGLPQMPASYFFTEMRWQELVQVLRQSNRPIPQRPAGVPPAPHSEVQWPVRHHFGTTGAVARDINGNIAAGTSTGGMQGKMPGRVGDSPIIGAGTYASNRACAVSATGVGEYFIRLSAAKEICSLVEYRGMSVQQAADHVIRNEVGALKGGEGGVIVLNQNTDPVWSFNTLGMFRARQTAHSAPDIQVEAARAALAH